MAATRRPRLLFLIALLAAFVPSLPAQVEEGTVDDPQARTADPEERRRQLEELRMSTPPLFVEIMQDPIRIAPGETGLLILRIQTPPDGNSKVRPGGTASYKKQQGNLTLGRAKFDPLAKGEKHYKNLLVRIPISVDAKAKYGKLPVEGKLRLPGAFAPPSADGKPVPLTPSTDPNMIPWAGAIVCGRPVPKPSVRRKRKSSAGSGAEAADRKRDEATAGGPDRKASSAKSSAAPIVGRGEESELEEGLLSPSGDGGDSLPPWLFLAVAGAGAALLLVFFVLQGRGKTA